MHIKLKEIRQKSNITQDKMASILGYRHKIGYNKLENGDRKISLNQAKIISDFLKKTIEEIFF